MLRNVHFKPLVWRPVLIFGLISDEYTAESLHIGLWWGTHATITSRWTFAVYILYCVHIES